MSKSGKVMDCQRLQSKKNFRKSPIFRFSENFHGKSWSSGDLGPILRWYKFRVAVFLQAFGQQEHRIPILKALLPFIAARTPRAQLSGKINWTYKLSKVYGWIHNQKHLWNN